MQTDNTFGIEEPKFEDLNKYIILFGMPLLPEEKLSTFDDGNYEEFTKCWLYAEFKDKYIKIENYYSRVHNIIKF